MRYIWLAAPILACLVLTSCVGAPLQGYEGAVRPDDETALVTLPRARQHWRVSSAQIVWVEWPDGTLAEETNRVRVLPGETCITVRATIRNSLEFYSAKLCLEAEAGKTYAIGAETVTTTAEATGVDESRIVGFSLKERGTRETIVESATSVN